MKTLLLSALMIFCLHGVVFSQEDTATSNVVYNPHVWNTLFITTIQNPALAGMEYRHQVYFDYGQPWFGNFDDAANRNNFSGGYDLVLKTFKNKFKIGMGAYFSMESLTHTKTRSVGLVNSFSVRFKNNSILGVGISVLGFTFKTIDYSNMRFPGQFSGFGFNLGLWSGELFSDDRFVNYGPLNIGVWYRAKNFFIGTSSLNFTIPKESFLNDNDLAVRTPIVSYTNAGYHFNIRGKAVITPSLQHRSETVFYESFDPLWIHSFQPRLTCGFSKNRFVAGAYYENDAVYFLAGADLFNHHWLINFDAGWYVNDHIDTGMQGFRIRTRVSF